MLADDDLLAVLEAFEQDARADLAVRWEAWTLDLANNEVHEVVGGLVARQVSLATQLAINPNIWNAHVAPLVLRAMVDLHITVAWILMQPVDRAQKYIAYGLGQAKLQIEHQKAVQTKQPDEANAIVVAALSAWLNAQRWDFLTDVNVGNWAGASSRDMAEEAGLMELYRFGYATFSEATHSMWHHVDSFNLRRCTEPLHGSHAVPIAPDQEPMIYYLQVAAQYLTMTCDLFDQHTKVQVAEPTAFKNLCQRLDALAQQVIDGQTPPV